MSFGLRLSLLLLIAGCAEGALLVAESDWMTVPAPQRTAIDQQHEKELSAARAELLSANAHLAAMPRAAAPLPKTTPPADPALAPSDPWGELLRDRERERGEERGRVEAATAELQRTDLAWRQLRVESADARLAVVISQRELVRGQAINRNMRGEDTYDTAPLRGQFSRAQQRWYAVAIRERAARDAYERASTDLASHKEAYAQVMRSLPMRAVEPDVTDDHDAKLALSGWSISRSDIRRRRGLRHFLDDAIAMQQLRRVTYLLRPIGRMPTVIAATPAPAKAPAPASAPAETPRTAAAPDRGSTPAPALAGKPPAPSNPAPDFEHPADRAARPAPAVLAAKPAVAKPERPAPPPNATAAATGKPPEPPHANQPALRPVERAAPQVNATAAVGKTETARTSQSTTATTKTEPPPAPASKPGPSRTPQTGVAKPVERPLSETDGHMR